MAGLRVLAIRLKLAGLLNYYEYFGLIAAILTFASWLVSSSLQSQADKIEKRIEEALLQFSSDEKFDNTMASLRNIEIGIARIEGKTDPELRAGQSLSLKGQLLAQIDTFQFTRIEWEDISESLSKAARLQVYAEEFGIHCGKAPKQTAFSLASCAMSVQVPPELASERSRFLALLKDISANVYEAPLCLSHEVSTVVAKLGVYEDTASLIDRTLRQWLTDKHASVWVDRPGNDKAADAQRAGLSWANSLNQECIGEAFYDLSFSVDNLAEKVIKQAREHTLLRAKIYARVSEWLALVLFASSSALSIIGKYIELQEKGATEEDPSAVERGT